MMKTKLLFLSFLLVHIAPIPLYAQDYYHVSGFPCDLLWVHETPRTSEYSFNVEEIDNVKNRLDSLFIPQDRSSDFAFKSYLPSGESFAIGFFHLHDSYIKIPMTAEEEASSLIKKPDQLTIHVHNYALQIDGEYHWAPYNECQYNWKTVKKGNLEFSGEDRMVNYLPRTT